jgi:hypothetical protein
LFKLYDRNSWLRLIKHHPDLHSSSTQHNEEMFFRGSKCKTITRWCLHTGHLCLLCLLQMKISTGKA